ncbi:MAG: hypothetical protein E5W88_00005 [Mesorhizobium sp.]|nr:MAG: hypothetical protein E5W88_00005 [Mesorhizobium sp.]
MQERCAGGAAIEGIGPARAAAAADDECHVIELQIAWLVDDLLHDCREVRGAFGKGGFIVHGPVGWRPRHRSSRHQARGDIAFLTLEGDGFVAFAPDQERDGAGARILGLELDVGTGDDGVVGNVDAGEAHSDRLDFGAVNHHVEIGAGEVHPAAGTLLDVVGAGCDPFLENRRCGHADGIVLARGAPIGRGRGDVEVDRRLGCRIERAGA